MATKKPSMGVSTRYVTIQPIHAKKFLTRKRKATKGPRMRMSAMCKAIQTINIR